MYIHTYLNRYIELLYFLFCGMRASTVQIKTEKGINGLHPSSTLTSIRGKRTRSSQTRDVIKCAPGVHRWAGLD